MAKLTEADVAWIREKSAAGMKPGTIALKFGLSRHHVQAIVHGQSWSHSR